MEKLKVVHIEDSDIERFDMAMAFKQTDNLLMVGSTGEAGEGLRLVATYHPDVVILDLELRRTGKDGAYFLRELSQLFIPFKPLVLVTTIIENEDILLPFRRLGADFVYSKSQRDYGPDLVIQFLTNLQEPLLKTKFTIRGTIYNVENQIKFVEQIDIELKKIGIKRSKGYNYLKEAIQLLYENNEEYKETIARKHGITPKKAEDTMQYRIKRAWNTSPIDDLREHYTGIIESKACIPSVKEFVSFYCEKIKTMLKG